MVGPESWNVSAFAEEKKEKDVIVEEKMRQAKLKKGSLFFFSFLLWPGHLWAPLPNFGYTNCDENDDDYDDDDVRIVQLSTWPIAVIH